MTQATPRVPFLQAQALPEAASVQRTGSAMEVFKASSLTSTTCSSPRSYAAPSSNSVSETEPVDILLRTPQGRRREGAPSEATPQASTVSLPPGMLLLPMAVGLEQPRTAKLTDAQASPRLVMSTLGNDTPTTLSTMSQDMLCGSCDEDGDGAADEPTKYLSMGSIGHPHSCAEACRYIKRKGGCLDGAKCSRCHLCFWTRVSEKLVVAPGPQGDQAIVSVGTKGHPHSCGEACRYARRKSGCRDGANCKNCHACLWQRRPSKHGFDTASVTEEGDDDRNAGPTPLMHVAPKPQAPLGASEKTEPGFFGPSSGKLTELIATLLVTRP
eukprot:CAMPEP_0176012736 /NCGR_PEP_ID=MMETSP0120_2-20121206/5949_1 /TAXON_ID=160619 /ORGANISM="Kryptoperidinium foliaceum, Strain CCMP 1326" /LENGTH=326 /DNA_ID=CAMNT_0017345631 /DNA_START=56 /DNA_END=1036 /DNA_ORIENTATION=-